MNHTTLSALLASLQKLGVGIRVRGTGKDARLSVSAPSGVLGDEMKAAIAQWRPDLLNHFKDIHWTEARIVAAIGTGLTPAEVLASQAVMATRTTTRRGTKREKANAS